ncbi:MAG: hypothetical protein GKR88_17340 [Flavobacteriaceae bacterium]|nr:MAG: hypothetical protein GKR88_17340 [Flavobacteriaceae bacterium]
MNFLPFFFVVSIFISCGDSAPEKKEISATGSKFSIPQEYVIPIEIDTANEKELSDWSHYIVLQEFMEKFKRTSPNEALSNALELSSLIKALKGNIKPEPLNTLSFKARIHVLENESLRLSDMTKISSIKADEIHDQISNIVAAFSAMNSKINTVYLEKNLNEQVIIEDFGVIIKDTKNNADRKWNKNRQKAEERIIKKGIPLKNNTNREEDILLKKGYKKKKS